VPSSVLIFPILTKINMIIHSFNFIKNASVINRIESVFLFFFLLWGGTRSLCMPALRPASQAGPMRNPRKGTSVVLRDTIRLT